MTELAGIQAALLKMSGEIGGLKSTVESISSQWARQETAASDGRARLHQKVEEVKQSVTKLDNRVDNLSTKVAAIEPAMQAFQKEELRQEGAKRLGAKLWGLMLLAAGAAGWAIHEAIGYLFHR
jgi:hypothetical protein